MTAKEKYAKTDQALRRLTPEQYRVTQLDATEPLIYAVILSVLLGSRVFARQRTVAQAGA